MEQMDETGLGRQKNTEVSEQTSVARGGPVFTTSVPPARTNWVISKGLLRANADDFAITKCNSRLGVAIGGAVYNLVCAAFESRS